MSRVSDKFDLIDYGHPYIVIMIGSSPCYVVIMTGSSPYYVVIMTGSSPCYVVIMTGSINVMS